MSRTEATFPGDICRQDLVSYFGTKATSAQVFMKTRPKEGEVKLELSLAQWAKEKLEIWDKVCDKSGVPEAKIAWVTGMWNFQDSLFQRTWSGMLSVSKAREFGWTGYLDSYRSFTADFERFRELKQIL